MTGTRVDSDGKKLPDNVVQRKDGTYMWKKMIDGKQYCIYAKTLGEIKEKRDIALGEIRQGKYKSKRQAQKEKEQEAQKNITVNEWFYTWEKEYRIGKVRPNTYQNDRKVWVLKFQDNIGQMRVADVRQIDIVKVYNQLKKDGARNKSMEVYHKVVRLVFEAAVNNGLIEKNPANRALNLPDEKLGKKRILTEEEERTFLDYLSKTKTQKQYVPLFVVGFGTGMRIGEILALQWKDIDFDNGIIHVNKTISYVTDYVGDRKKYFSITPGKTETSVRKVPMSPKVREALEIQKKDGYKGTNTIDGYNDFVFNTKNGRPITASNINGTIIKAVDNYNMLENEQAQLENRKPVLLERFSCHTMRHTFATRCYEKGVREKVVQDILGHKSLNMTLGVYTHTTDKMIEEDMKKLWNNE